MRSCAKKPQTTEYFQNDVDLKDWVTFFLVYSRDTHSSIIKYFGKFNSLLPYSERQNDHTDDY